MPSSPKYLNSRQSLSLARRSTALIISCLIIGIAGFVFGTSAILAASRGGYSCKNSEPRSVRVVWERDRGFKSGSDGVVLSEKRHKVMGFVGIQTGFGSVGRRRSLRKTWMPSDPQGLQRLEESTGLAFRFVIGRTNDKAKMAELQNEIAEYDDFLLLDIEEQYSKLPYKTLAFFKAAYALFDSEFYVKADDDIYLRPDRLSLLLAKERSHSQTYLGCMKKGPVFTDPKLKWYEPLSYMLGNEYFLHAYGPIYALSADVVASLVALRNNSFRMFSNEDVTIGAWMLAMNVKHEDNRALCEPECTPSSIAVWDIPKCSGLCNPEKKLLEHHQKESCSKSPTLASDD
ncbi:galactosyltransferase family protein [Tripterygium wilfordii]|uniref:Hexosyltransferase n=1 Tax=Tripterygium wilfordii TaxID=458696 RepID=A0A7J7C1L4_TRIWF|nr:probable beta-1,3-galactosyltransferase 14 [Tripterygium wilfordii]KAF5728049.1 galactosyltransferase family protein [Tripterygium wilfordii]